MSSEGRLSHTQKGKAVATESSPARDVDRAPLDDFERVHHDAMMDTRSLGLSERLLVSESARLHRREVARITTEAQTCTRDGQDGTRDGTPPVDFVPICYYPGGIFEELPSLSPEMLRSPEARGQTWENVLPTRSTVESVKRLLRGVRVTFLIPTGEQRPWSPPIGFQCVYESYFQDDTKIWFPIPRLVTSYARRQDAAISQFLNGSWGLAVALMVMAAEINVTLNVRAFEELTSVNPLDEGLWSVKMRPNYNVVKGCPNKTAIIRLCANTQKSFLSNARAIARLQQERWGNITRDRIRRCVDRISRNLPRPEPADPPSERGFTGVSNVIPERRDLSSADVAAASKRKDSRKRSHDDPPVHKPYERISEGADVVIEAGEVEPSKTKKKKKQSDDRRSPPREGSAINLALTDDPNDTSPPPQLHLRKKLKKTTEQGVVLREAPPVAPPRTSTDLSVGGASDVPTPKTSTGGVPVIKKIPKCPELMNQIRGGPRPLPPVADLIFKDEYADTARIKLLSDGSFNFIIEKYDAALKEALADSAKLKEIMMVAKRERGIARRKIHQERANVAEADLRIANATISTLETKTGQLQEKIGLDAESHKEELARLRESRTFEVTKERNYQTRRAPFKTMRLLQSQAFGTRKCLEALKASGRDIPQKTIEMFAAQEKHFEEEALKLDVGEIPEADLTLCPLNLDSQFVDERAIVGLDPFGSNTNLIDARTASFLHTPSSPREIHAGTSASLDPRPTDENVAFASGGDQPAILLLSDSSAAGQEED
ncbi:LOW QUALITY PROTEIN: hypothetical protein N665_0158s0016 [Sinapis alba]|nr:LOW QUALITY PROTEIN: hypothetical protein N665_0158s0016 [Sinapis alba]